MLESFISFLSTFIYLLVELLLLFTIISFIVSMIQQYFPEEKIRALLSQPKPVTNYFMSIIFGLITPFCSCSTIPVLVGLLNAKVPFGPAITFLISSPLLDPIIMSLLWALLGWRVAVVYFIVVTLFSIVVGILFNYFDLDKTYKSVSVDASQKRNNKVHSKIKQALSDTWSFLYPMLPYLFIGVLIGALIYDFVPETLITTIAGGKSIISLIVGSIIGIPMYVRPETMIPISQALVSKGMAIGTVIALLIGGTGASIPEIVMLSKLFKTKFLIAFISAILLVAISTGFLINLLY